jgi:hypothetical protein
MSNSRFYRSEIPEGISEDWSVRKFSISNKVAQASSLQAMFNSGRGEIEEGNYTGLYRNGQIIMSDSPDEIDDFRWFTRFATGNILVTGLGLGCVTEMLAKKEEVFHITVVEKSSDVISLVSKYLLEKYPKITIINEDAYAYKAKEHFDMAWHDIWDTLCADNLPEMKKIRRHYGIKMNDSGMQFCWGEDYIRNSC